MYTCKQRGRCVHIFVSACFLSIYMLHAFMHSPSATETAAVPGGVCFEVVPGIRSQGGANPGRWLLGEKGFLWYAPDQQ